MVFKGLIAATASVALMVTPAVAAAQTAQAAGASTEVSPSDETVTDGSQLRGGFVIPLIALIAIILGILAATHDNDDQLPHSP